MAENRLGQETHIWVLDVFEIATNLGFLFCIYILK